jgi:hypothetical protein
MTIQPVNLKDITVFLDNVIYVFQDVIFLGFILLLTFTVIYNLRKIMIGNHVK